MRHPLARRGHVLDLAHLGGVQEQRSGASAVRGPIQGFVVVLRIENSFLFLLRRTELGDDELLQERDIQLGPGRGAGRRTMCGLEGQGQIGLAALERQSEHRGGPALCAHRVDELCANRGLRLGCKWIFLQVEGVGEQRLHLIERRQRRRRHPVRGQHGESRIFDRREEHEDAVVGLQALDVAGLLAAQLLIIQRRFVPMVAVGDEDGLAGHGCRDFLGDRRIGDGPEALLKPDIVAEFHAGRSRFRRLGQCGQDGVLRIGIERPDRAEIRAAGFHQIQAIGLGGGAGVLVRIDCSGAELFQLERGNEAPQRFSRALGVGSRRNIFDGVVVNRRLRVPFQRARLHPLRQRGAGSGVAVVGRAVTGLVHTQFQANDVVRVPVVEGFLAGCVDNVIGRRGDIACRTGNGGIVARTAKGKNLGHDRFVLL